MGVWTIVWQIVVVTVSALLAVLTWLWITRRRTTAPGPSPIPLLGNLPHFWHKLPVVVNDFRALQRSYGDVFRIYIGPILFLVVTQPDDARRILVGLKSRSRDSYTLRALVPFSGYGLITSKGERWKIHRKLIEPRFHPEVLSGYSEGFNTSARFLCSQLAETTGVEVDVSKMLLHSAFHFFTLTFLGVNFDEIVTDRKTQAEYVDVFIAGLKLIQKRFYQPWLQSEFVISLTPDGKELKKQVGIYNYVTKQGMTMMRERRLKGKSTKRKSFLDVMMDEQGNFLLSESEVYDEVRTFGLAGMDTTATALSCIFALLGLHPEWQDEIQKEVDDIFGNGDDYMRSVTDSDLVQLKVTEAVIKESLRLFPAVPLASVHVSEDVPLSGGKYVAPKDCGIFVFLSLLHRQPSLFPDPDKFDPGRFLEGGSATQLPPYSFLPFGAGARNCVGSRYAMQVMKTVLSTVMRQFRFTAGVTREELEEIAVFITGKPVHGIKITCFPRTSPSAMNST